MKKLFLFLLTFSIVVACGKESSTSGSTSGEESGGASSFFANVLDLKFSGDASATDASALKNTVVHNAGYNLSAYYNSSYKIYVAHFGGDLGSTRGSGFYRIAYSDAMLAKIAQGFTMETMFSLDQLPSGSVTCAPFASYSDAGFGFYVSKLASGAHICFHAKIGENEVVLDSGITPELATYYHVVVSWDYSSSKITMYVDGESVASASTSGDLVTSSSSGSQWICVGGNCSSAINYNSASWKGDVVLARIYSESASASQASTLYTKIRKVQNPVQINITSLSYLTPCNVAKGYKYYIYGEGFETGDVIMLQANSDNGYHTCTTQIKNVSSPSYNSAAIIELPDDIADGSYSIYLVRGQYSKFLGTTTFSLSGTPDTEQITKVCAHRCLHTSYAENSLKAFKATQTAGIWAAEFDVWVTTDGVVYVNHDAELKGVTIENSTSSVVGKLTLSDGQYVATLESFFKQAVKYPDVIMYFEIKKHSTAAKNQLCAKQIATLAKKYGVEDQIEVMSYSDVALSQLKTSLPGVKTNWLGTDDPSTLIDSGVLRYSGISYNMNTLTSHPDWISWCLENGMSVNTWTTDTVADITTFIGLRATSVTTNQVTLAKNVTSRPYLEAN